MSAEMATSKAGLMERIGGVVWSGRSREARKYSKGGKYQN